MHTDRTGQKKNRTSTNDSTHGPVSNYQSPPSTDSCNTAGEQLSLSRSEWAIKSVAQTIPSCCWLEWSISSTAAIPGCHFPFKSYAIKWDKMRGTGHNWPQLWLVPRCFQTRSFRSVAQEQVRVTGVLAWVMHTEKPTLCGWEILYKWRFSSRKSSNYGGFPIALLEGYLTLDFYTSQSSVIWILVNSPSSLGATNPFFCDEILIFLLGKWSFFRWTLRLQYLFFPNLCAKEFFPNSWLPSDHFN